MTEGSAGDPEPPTNEAAPSVAPSVAAPSTSSPSLPGPTDRQPVFRHLDDADLPWQAVKAQRNADGTLSRVWEKWLAFSPDPQYLSLYARYDAGMVVRRHGHFSPHLVFVLQGEVVFGDRRCPAGTHVVLPLGAAFGPIVAGAEGAVLFEVMLGDPRSWGEDPEAFHRALADRGAEPLPDPPLEYPDWLVDLRAHWSGAEPVDAE